MVLGGGLLCPLYSEVETEAGRGGVTCPRSRRFEVTLRQALLSPNPGRPGLCLWLPSLQAQSIL